MTVIVTPPPDLRQCQAIDSWDASKSSERAAPRPLSGGLHLPVPARARVCARRLREAPSPGLERRPPEMAVFGVKAVKSQSQGLGGAE